MQIQTERTAISRMMEGPKLPKGKVKGMQKDTSYTHMRSQGKLKLSELNSWRGDDNEALNIVIVFLGE